jgi:hypothetical protein
LEKPVEALLHIAWNQELDPPTSLGAAIVAVREIDLTGPTPGKLMKLSDKLPNETSGKHHLFGKAARCKCYRIHAYPLTDFIVRRCFFVNKIFGTVS